MTIIGMQVTQVITRYVNPWPSNAVHSVERGGSFCRRMPTIVSASITTSHVSATGAQE